ncbi:MAG: hypothetical protein GY822_23050 [Deltaproteobacteria bacterium]|nr:hypothetical protein [Deltaproteobacteria bacterium]
MANDDLTNVEITTIYAASSAIEADRIVLLLEEEGLKANQQESSVSGIPTDSGHRFLVTCFSNLSEQARDVIKAAIGDEVISSNGSFLEG